MTLEDLQNYYTKNRSTQNLKSYASEIEPNITLEEMDVIANSIIDKYPDLYNLTDTDIETIQNDFNGINEITISENIELIDSFYNALIRFEFVDTLSKYTPSKLKSYSDYFGYDVSSAEFWALVWHPRLVNSTMKATNKTIELTGNKFPNQGAWRNKADAFRHAIWNALIAKYVGDQKNSIDKCIEWAKLFTDKHEEGSVKPADMTDEDFEFDHAMDYQNNKIGRDYFKSVAWTEKKCWLCSTVVLAPSDETISDAIYNKTTVAKKVASKSEINSFPNYLVYIKD